MQASDIARMREQPHVSVPSGIEHQAEATTAQAAAQEANPAAHALARRTTHVLSDIFSPENLNSAQQQPAWQPRPPPAPSAPWPDQQYRDPLQDPLQDPLLSSGEPYAESGLYGQLRKASLRALRKGA